MARIPGARDWWKTPDRIARACRELFAGLQASPADVLEKHFDVDTDELVLVKDIELYSVCEHHLLPFHGVAHVGYIPAKGWGDGAEQSSPDWLRCMLAGRRCRSV